MPTRRTRPLPDPAFRVSGGDFMTAHPHGASARARARRSSLEGVSRARREIRRVRPGAVPVTARGLTAAERLLLPYNTLALPIINYIIKG